MQNSVTFRTRAQIAQELGICTKTLGVIIKEANIEIPPRKLISHSQYKAILELVS